MDRAVGEVDVSDARARDQLRSVRGDVVRIGRWLSQSLSRGTPAVRCGDVRRSLQQHRAERRRLGLDVVCARLWVKFELSSPGPHDGSAGCLRTRVRPRTCARRVALGSG